MESIYSIKDFAKTLDISICAVRKWEDDYQLCIPRNELGHRFYTQREIDIFKKIIKLKDEGANIHLIRKILVNEGVIEELQEENLPQMAEEKLKLEEFEESIITRIGDYIVQREDQMRREFEEKLEKAKEEIIIKQQEQIQSENSKLMDYIAASREDDTKKKGLFSKLFGK